MTPTDPQNPRTPTLFPASEDWDSNPLSVATAGNPLPLATLCDLPVAASISGPDTFPLTVLILPFDPPALAGIDAGAVRMFRFDEKARALRPIWNSGINVGLGFVWAKVQRPGVFVPVGLPLDPIVLGLIRNLAHIRAHTDGDSPDEMNRLTHDVCQGFWDTPDEELAELRRSTAVSRVQLGETPVPPNQLERGGGFHVTGILLPRAATLADFKAKLAALETFNCLPEENLLLPPERALGEDPLVTPIDRDTLSATEETVAKLTPTFSGTPPVPHTQCSSPDWPMYQHDASHSGNASGCGTLNSTTVSKLKAVQPVNLPHGGTILAKPTVVGGEVYICVTQVTGLAGVGGFLHKIDLATFSVTHSFPISNSRSAYYPGGGGSPAVVGGQVFFTGLPGWVYCIDAATFSLVWQTDLRVPDKMKNQPVKNPQADSWSSPVVVNGRVYVGCGEGEMGAYGFIYCLDATNGHVVWLYSTDQFKTTVDNSPNVIPAGAVGLSPLPTGFTSHTDPPQVGANVWSSCAYDAKLDRIYVGLGNSSTGGGPPGAIDYKYGSGVIALDAKTGDFKGYFQPAPSDSYYPGDDDADICSSPLLFTRGGKRIVAIGSKTGAFMLLDAGTMAPLAVRNMLPRDSVTGGPLPGVDPGGMGGGENKWGVFGTPAVHSGTGRLFVGVGGYAGIGISSFTPFIRAVDWTTLKDAWPTAIASIPPNHVAKYTTAAPPMYSSNEVGLSSPAVVSDLVFISTDKSALYAFDVNTGVSLWTAPGLPANQFVLGPVVADGYVIVGAGGAVHFYH